MVINIANGNSPNMCKIQNTECPIPYPFNLPVLVNGQINKIPDCKLLAERGTGSGREKRRGGEREREGDGESGEKKGEKSYTFSNKLTRISNLLSFYSDLMLLNKGVFWLKYWIYHN